VSDQAILDWLNTENISVAVNRGFDVFQNETTDCCKVVRLDEKNIVVGGRNEIDRALASEDGNPTMERYLTEDMLKSEIHLVVDVQRVMKSERVTKMAQTLIELIETVQFSQSDNSTIASLPRPKEIDELMQMYAEATRIVSQRAENQFKEIARDLEETEKAAAEAAFQALQ